MTDQEKMDVATRLEQRIPLLQKFYPDGWKDFRSPLLAEWRAGLFFRIASMFDIEDAPALDEIWCKTMVGGGALAGEIASQVSALIGKPVAVRPPGPEAFGMDGETHITKTQYWRLEFSVRESEVSW